MKIGVNASTSVFLKTWRLTLQLDSDHTCACGEDGAAGSRNQCDGARRGHVDLTTFVIKFVKKKKIQRDRGPWGPGRVFFLPDPVRQGWLDDRAKKRAKIDDGVIGEPLVFPIQALREDVDDNPDDDTRLIAFEFGGLFPWPGFGLVRLCVEAVFPAASSLLSLTNEGPFLS